MWPQAARYLRRLLPSLSSSIEDGSTKSYSIKLWSNSSTAIRVAFRVFGFSISGGAPAIICRARLAASTTYANWLSGAFVSTVISVFSSKRCQKLFHSCAAPRTGTSQCRHNRLRLASRAFHIFIHHTIIVVFAESCNLVPGLGQPPRDFFVRILPAAAQPAFQFFTRRRQNKNGHRLRKLLFHLGRALHVDFKHQVESLAARFLQPFLGRAVGMLAENPRVFQKFAAPHHGVEFGFRDVSIAFPAGLGRAARPSSTRHRRHGAGKFQNSLYQRRFSRSRRARHDQY